jgi:hypothetical protein
VNPEGAIILAAVCAFVGHVALAVTVLVIRDALRAIFELVEWI